MIELDIKAPLGHESLQISVNGELAAQVIVGGVDTPRTLLARVAKANAMIHLPQIVSSMRDRLLSIRNISDEGKGPDQKAKGFCDGLADGMGKKLILHSPDVPAYRPTAGTAYDLGYEYGACIVACLEAATKEIG